MFFGPEALDNVDHEPAGPFPEAQEDDEETAHDREYIKQNLSVDSQLEKYAEIYKDVIEKNRMGENG